MTEYNHSISVDIRDLDRVLALLRGADPKEAHHRIVALSRAVLRLMSCKGLTEAEYSLAADIWELAAQLENGREDRRRPHHREELL